MPDLRIPTSVGKFLTKLEPISKSLSKFYFALHKGRGKFAMEFSFVAPLSE